MPNHIAGLPTVVPMGLLEQALLHVRGADATGRRRLDDESGRAVGFARLRAGWLPWGAALAVHESFEEPIVFRVRRLWTLWPRWAVADAEGESVGTVARAALFDRWDRLLYRREGGGRFVSADGTPAAEWAGDAGSGQLFLHPAARDDPFAKMLLLAAVLVSG